jgi:hypothetical protein
MIIARRIARIVKKNKSTFYESKPSLSFSIFKSLAYYE